MIWSCLFQVVSKEILDPINVEFWFKSGVTVSVEK